MYTGISKLLTHNSFNLDLINTKIDRVVVPVLSIVVPLVEIFVGLLLLAGRFRKFALKCSFWLMMAFTLYVGVILAFAESKPCACGGVIRTMSWNQHLWFNIFFTLLAFVGVKLSRNERESKRQLIVQRT
jgi:uncharacterized membrane protein YphA (DoxX/SURF4 family)